MKIKAFDKILGLNNAPKATKSTNDTIEGLSPAEIEAAVLLLQDDLDDAPAKEPEVVKALTADEKWLRGVKRAQTELKDFRLSVRTKLLLQTACENVASNTGNGIEDMVAREEIKSRAALFAAAKHSLVDVLKIIKASVGAESVPGMVYSTCFAVQKAANFVTNLSYRRALDPKNGEGNPAHDHRDLPDPPVGLGPDGDEPLQFNDEVEHPDTTECRHTEILRAFEDLHLYLQLLCELHGWDTDAQMPYMFEMNLDGTFAPVWGAQQALDLMEVRSAASRLRRTAKRTANLAAALAAAGDVLERASR